MGWWGIVGGVMGDAPADQVAGLFDELRKEAEARGEERPRLEELLSALERALSEAPKEILSDSRRYSSFRLCALVRPDFGDDPWPDPLPEPQKVLAGGEPRPWVLAHLRKACRWISESYQFSFSRAPRLHELLSAFSFVLRVRTGQYLAGMEGLSANNLLPEDLRRPPSPPPLPDGVILRPEFHTIKGTFRAGTAFPLCLSEGAAPLLVSTQHLFGPAGGLGMEIPTESMPRYVKKVVLFDAFGGAELGSAGPVLPIAQAKAQEPALDLLAFRGLSLPAAPLLLAEAEPAEEEEVWLAAAIKSERDLGRLHEGRVLSAKHGVMSFQYEEPIPLQATSGAPVLNAKGQVVGVHVRFQLTRNKLISTAIAVGTLRGLLGRALSSPRSSSH